MSHTGIRGVQLIYIRQNILSELLPMLGLQTNALLDKSRHFYIYSGNNKAKQDQSCRDLLYVIVEKVLKTKQLLPNMERMFKPSFGAVLCVEGSTDTAHDHRAIVLYVSKLFTRCHVKSIE
jgi:hypothetical protein